MPENEGAMFQVASNFNGIEAISEDSFPDTDDFISKYGYDETQGPIASISAGAAAISRVLLPFYNNDTKNSPASEWRQTRYRQVNFLEELEEYFTVRNGYIVQRGSERIPENNWEIVGRVHVGIQVGAQVSLGHATRKEGGEAQLECVPEGLCQRISQVFCAAMNLAQGDTGRTNCLSCTKNRVDLLLLEAAYRGTYLAALRHGTPCLYLTFIGGGAFGNSITDILNVIEKVHIDTACTEKNTTLMEVHVVMFDVYDKIIPFLNNLKDKGVEVEAHEYGGGSMLIYTEF